MSDQVRLIDVDILIYTFMLMMFSSAVLLSSGASVHSTSSTPTSVSQPSLTQATAFVQPTQQQAANQEAIPSMEAERPSTSSSVTGPGDHLIYNELLTERSLSSCSPYSQLLRWVFVCLLVMQAGSKRSRDEEEEEEENRPESSHTPPTTKKLRLKPAMALQVTKSTTLKIKHSHEG